MPRPLSAGEAADLIERFLNGRSLYPQEWNDFVEGKRGERDTEPYRRRCAQLDPLVNCPDPPGPEALNELKEIVSALRKISAQKRDR